MTRGLLNEAGEVIKAGCVVINGEGKLLLVKDVTANYDYWSLPKGHAEPGEELVDVATRETREETGWRVDIIRPLGDVRYFSKVENEAVILHLYLAEPAELLEKTEPDEWPEWFAFDKLEGKLYPDIIKFLRAQRVI
jgi:8-oxo-dGTP pyrophosphatase MutT (NUDIX family)